MDLVERIDAYGRPAWLTLMIVSFIVFWPLGLFILGYLIWSGRMGCWKKGKVAAYNSHDTDHGNGRGPGRWYRAGGMRPTGNRAFDEYREETLRRLEEEREEFQSYLDRLRHARDKEEFDRFMAERSRKADVSDVEPDTRPGSDTEARPAG